MSAQAPLIEMRELARAFKNVRAVDGLSLSIDKGELFGLIGPDGAGKTTTLRLLAGLLDPSEGEASVLGYDLATKAESIKPYIGYMAQQFSLYAELSVLENLQFFAELFDVPAAEASERTERLLSFAGLQDFRRRRAAYLSGGMQKKLALACTLIHQPQILLLDEPTTGVDPISRREFWNILSELHAQGTTIIVSTPYMDEADRCSRVGLMYAGKMMECDSPRNLKARLVAEVLEILPDDPQEVERVLSGLSGIRELQSYGSAVHAVVDSVDKRMPEIEEALREARVPYRSIRRAPGRMEEAFLSLIGGLET
jgi:ABC-2 type transport system ATP-binding protein